LSATFGVGQALMPMVEGVVGIEMSHLVRSILDEAQRGSSARSRAAVRVITGATTWAVVVDWDGDGAA